MNLEVLLHGKNLTLCKKKYINSLNFQACCKFPNVSDSVAEAKIQEFMKSPENFKMQPGDQFTLACVRILSFIFKAMDENLFFVKNI